LVDDILAKYPNDVKVVIKNFPLSFHKQAYKAAQYALAAHAQGKYKEMYKAIFANYKKLKSNEDWPLEIAQDLGLDMNQFVKDFSSDKIKKQIDLEMNQFRNSGIPRLAVPKFLIQGKEPQGRDLATFSAMIDAELAKLK
jgi:predicted DsbA family dithiol-disulfide isomerase